MVVSARLVTTLAAVLIAIVAITALSGGGIPIAPLHAKLMLGGAGALFASVVISILYNNSQDAKPLPPHP